MGISPLSGGRKLCKISLKNGKNIFWPINSGGPTATNFGHKLSFLVFLDREFGQILIYFLPKPPLKGTDMKVQNVLGFDRIVFLFFLDGKPQ